MKEPVADNAPENSGSASDSAAAGRPFGFGLRRLLQFRLRTLLLLTVAAAFYTQWSLRPKPDTQRFGDYRIFRHLVTPTGDGEETQIEDGAYWITDKAGRLLVRGAYHQGKPAGKWRTYHPNGRLASVGSCDQKTGGRTGVWKSYHASGGLMQRVEYGKPRENVGAWIAFHTGVNVREGPAEGWHENGQLHWRGSYEGDVQSGDWEFYDAEGRLIAEGGYQRGLRHGRWKIAESGDALRTVYYIHGLPSPDPGQVGEEQLEQWIAGNSSKRRLEAIRLAADQGKWQWLATQLPGLPSPTRLQVLKAAIPYEAAAAPLLETAVELEGAASPRLAAASRALRYSSARPSQRPQLLQEFTRLPPNERRHVAGALVELDPFWFRQVMRTESVEVSRFALQCLLCRWADRRNDYHVRTGQFPSGASVRKVLQKADEDEQIPELVRDMIAQWLHDTGPKGLQGGFF